MTADAMAELWALAQDPATEWMTWAICPETDPDLFSPVTVGGGYLRPGDGQKVREAKRLCAGCPVEAECLAYALEHGLVGVWGGTTEAERLDLKAEAGVELAA